MMNIQLSSSNSQLRLEVDVPPLMVVNRHAPTDAIEFIPIEEAITYLTAFAGLWGEWSEGAAL